ncbi:MAG: GNAT family N-acetyltransferase [Bdellovibrionota bacterium]
MLTLPPGYEIRSMHRDEFKPSFEAHKARFFGDTMPVFSPLAALSEEERARADALGKRLGEAFQLRLGLFHENRFIGWSWGYQESSETYYMCNSAVFPEHRRKGLYAGLIRRTLDEVVPLGFQKIYSRHNATNNAVIIPKLQAGFTISGMELSDKFGTTVTLTYYPSELRRKITDYRAGWSYADPEVKKHLKLP